MYNGTPPLENPFQFDRYCNTSRNEYPVRFEAILFAEVDLLDARLIVCNQLIDRDDTGGGIYNQYNNF